MVCLLWWFPGLAHVLVLWLVYRIAKSPVDLGLWRVKWTCAALAAISYLAWCIYNIYLMRAYGEPLDLARLLTASAGSYAFLAMTLCSHQIYAHTRARAGPVRVGQVKINWDDKILTWNDAASAILGWTGEDAIGQDLADLIIPPDFIIHGRLARELHREGIQRFLMTGESEIIDVLYPAKALHKDGRSIDVHIYVTALIDLEGIKFFGSILQR